MVDLNKLKDKLRTQQRVGVNQDGTLEERDPGNDGTREARKGKTTLESKRFFKGKEQS